MKTDDRMHTLMNSNSQNSACTTHYALLSPQPQDHKRQRGECSAGPWQSSARLSACAHAAAHAAK
eukprot:scaffold6760_cov119-Isochrysis_galbana.AAC.9